MKDIIHTIIDMQKDLFECFRKATVSEKSVVKMNRMIEGETTINSMRESVSAFINKDDNNDRRSDFGLG